MLIPQEWHTGLITSWTKLTRPKVSITTVSDLTMLLYWIMGTRHLFVIFAASTPSLDYIVRYTALQWSAVTKSYSVLGCNSSASLNPQHLRLSCQTKQNSQFGGLCHFLSMLVCSPCDYVSVCHCWTMWSFRHMLLEILHKLFWMLQIFVCLAFCVHVCQQNSLTTM